MDVILKIVGIHESMEKGNFVNFMPELLITLLGLKNFQYCVKVDKAHRQILHNGP